jgi:hypothetical protein
LVVLGEQLGEERGQITGMRVLPPQGQGPTVEVSFQAAGKIVGADVTDIGTYISAARPDGTLFGEGQGVVMTTDGGVATWRGQGSGRFTGPGGAISWRGAVYYETASAQLSRLNGVAVVYEYEADESGKTEAKYWEWK